MTKRKISNPKGYRSLFEAETRGEYDYLLAKVEGLSPEEIESGRIKGPGKFEGEPTYLLYFWDLYMNGFSDEQEGSDGVLYSVFELGAGEHSLFPELKNYLYLVLWETDQGFVMHETLESEEEVDEMIGEPPNEE